ncbi:MAG: protease complex subunit PrcB family protein [Inquilinaceae bacterium]
MSAVSARGVGTALAAGAALVLAGCTDVPGGEGSARGPAADAVAAAEPAPAPAPQLNGQRTWRGTNSAAMMEIDAVARDARGWDILWQLAGEPAPGPLPEGAMAFGVFLGERPTGGFGAEITDVQIGIDEVVVTYREIVPPADALLTQGFTAPYAVHMSRFSDKPVRFVRAE